VYKPVSTSPDARAAKVASLKAFEAEGYLAV
jgi:hypothetical protein